ncbi:3-isopropylmalate dehydratase [Lentisphaerota bacterium ZTH]|nr:3-isopropylmalate dehydratase [Lentisphaerota bacterium]WET07089.1 3-isopropylmalate dehydratase [Lentisphaerota bacterium ZTH]
MANIIKGRVFVVGDNIDTDQIIPAQYLNLVPTIKEEYEKLGSYALIGLPDEYKTRYVAEGGMKTEYPIVIGGSNFGCGSSREHAPISLGAAGCKVVIANSFARIFFRNCIATGEVFPVEIDDQLSKKLQTGDEVEVDLDNNTVKIVTSGETLESRDLGAVKEVINAGGIFNYARKSGMIK